MIPILRPATALLLALALLPVATAQPGGMGGDGHHDVIQALIDGHAAITRRVVDRPDGVETWTESDDPAMAALIRTHVRQMSERLVAGQPVRRWDPLFAAIFERHADIVMTMTDTERGIHVVETSAVPEVAALIRQHAHRAVSEFVAEGRARYERPTPLPGQTETPDVTYPMRGEGGGMQGGMHGAGMHGGMQGGMQGGGMHRAGMQGGGTPAAAPAPQSHTMHSEDASPLPGPMPSLPAFSDDRFATAPLFTTPGVRVVGFAFRAGQAIGAHSTGEDAFLLVTEGRVRVVIGDAPHELDAGAGLALPGGVPHAVEALTDARAVLVRTR